MALTHQDRIDAGISFDWNALPAVEVSLANVPQDTVELRFCRERFSFRGINRFNSLKRVWLYSVNQDFLEALSEVSTLETIYIKGFTATDLKPLSKLKQLRRLVLENNPKVENLDWVRGLGDLNALLISDFKRIKNLEPLGDLPNLSALGVEGGMDTPMRVDSLEPISKLLKLRLLTLTNLRVTDKKLSPLSSLKNLEVLYCARFFPDTEFSDLQKALPKLKCQWFEMIENHGSSSLGIRALTKKLFGA
jgi:Leucine-rich repeat (LRR) protein